METKVTAAHLERALAKTMWLHDFRVALWFELYDGYERELIEEARQVVATKVQRFSQVGPSRGITLEMTDGSRFLITVEAVSPR